MIRFHAIMVDNGVLRMNEGKQVHEMLNRDLGVNLKVVDASDLFLSRLEGVEDPEQKRKIIGNTFINVFEAEAAKIEAEAEEDEKMARVRRAEARAREKDAEREAREKAREQRRLEREERVKHDQEEKEREKYVFNSRFVLSRGLTARSAEVDVVTMTPAPAPSVNGASSSKRASHTPSGVRSPDWILDCEICQKSGRNLVSSTLHRASCRLLTKFRLGRWHCDGML